MGTNFSNWTVEKIIYDNPCNSQEMDREEKWDAILRDVDWNVKEKKVLSKFTVVVLCVYSFSSQVTKNSSGSSKIFSFIKWLRKDFASLLQRVR